MGKIVWLASYPKSGNTWLRAFLYNLLRDPAGSPDINLLRDPAGSPDINKLHEIAFGDSRPDWYQAFDPRPIEQWTKEEVQRVRPKVHEAMTRARPGKVFVKTHNAVVVSYGVPMIAPAHTAGAIYVIRNPLDVVVSYSHHFGMTVDRTIAFLNKRGIEYKNEANAVYEFHGSWSDHVWSWTQTPHPALLILRYEDMLDTPSETFGRVAAYLGLKPSDEQLDHAIRLSSFRNLRQQEQERGFVERHAKSERFFRDGRAGQWREGLTPEQIATIMDANKQQMSRFGYWPLPDETADVSNHHRPV